MLTCTVDTSKLVEEMKDVAMWYAEHRNTPMDLPNRVEFLVKANDHLVWLLANVLQEVINVKYRSKQEERFSGFFLPGGINLKQDIRVRD